MAYGKVDGNQAIKSAITKKFPPSARQRCVVHKLDNGLSYVPNKQQEQIEPELKALFSQNNREAADQAVAADHSRTIRRSIQRQSSGCLVIWKSA